MKLFDNSPYQSNCAIRIQYPDCFWDAEQPVFTLNIASKTYRFVNMMPLEQKPVLLTFIKQEPNGADINEVIDAMKDAIDEQLGYHANRSSNGTEVIGFIYSSPLAKL